MARSPWKALLIGESGICQHFEKNIRVKIDAPLADGSGFFQMSGMLTTLNLGANAGAGATIDIAVAGNGEVTSTITVWYHVP